MRMHCSSCTSNWWPGEGLGGKMRRHSAFVVCQSTGANMWISSTWALKALGWNGWGAGGTAFAIYDSWNVKRTAPNRRHLRVLSTPFVGESSPWAQLFLICHGHAAPPPPKKGAKCPPSQLCYPLINQVNGHVNCMMIAPWRWFYTPNKVSIRRTSIKFNNPDLIQTNKIKPLLWKYY